jgi:tetratricopeptide (TPR) repeat protein
MLGIDRERTEKEEAVEGFVSNSIDNYVTVMNFDTENDSEFEQIQALYNEGRYDEGDEIIDVRKLDSQVNQRLTVKAAGKKKDETLVSKLLYLVKRALAKKETNWYSLTDKYYAQALELYESYEACYTYAHFLSSQNRKDDAYVYYKKALSHANTQLDRVNSLNSFGAIYMSRFFFKKAGARFKDARDIYVKLGEDNYPKFQLEVAGSSQNLARAYSQIDNSEENPEFLFDKAIETYKALIKLGFLTNKYNLAVALNNKGNLLLNKALLLPTRERNEKFVQVELLFNYALKVNQKLADSHKENDLSHLTKVLNNLGVLKYYQGLMNEAEIRHLEACVIRRVLQNLTQMPMFHF